MPFITSRVLFEHCLNNYNLEYLIPEAEVSNTVCPLRELTKILSSDVCFSRVARLARGFQKKQPDETIQWARLLRASWAKELGCCVASPGEPWKLLEQRTDTVDRSRTKFP